MEKRNPCDVCSAGAKCDECVLGGLDRCYNSECFVNLDDTNTCLIGIIQDCGAWISKEEFLKKEADKKCEPSQS